MCQDASGIIRNHGRTRDNRALGHRCHRNTPRHAGGEIRLVDATDSPGATTPVTSKTKKPETDQKTRVKWGCNLARNSLTTDTHVLCREDVVNEQLSVKRRITIPSPLKGIGGCQSPVCQNGRIPN